MSLSAEKFQAAAMALAGSGPIKQRLIGAYLDNLVDVDDEGLPAELREEFAQLLESLNRVPPLGNEGRVLATVRKMSNREADECAQRIICLFGELVRCEAEHALQERTHRYMRRVG